jgi:hypothetical protein
MAENPAAMSMKANESSIFFSVSSENENNQPMAYQRKWRGAGINNGSVGVWHGVSSWLSANENNNIMYRCVSGG